MKKIIVFLAVLALAAGCLFAEEKAKLPGKYTKEYAQSLLSNVDESMYPKIFKSEMTMETVRPGRPVVKYTYTIYSKGSDQALMEITFPKRDVGKKILLKGENLWMYMPNVSRPIRLTRSQSFMSSTFSNEDMTDTTWANDYDAEITEVKGVHIKLVLTAKIRDVAYAKIEMWVDDEKKVPFEAVYYGLSGKAIKKMTFSNIKEMAGRLRPVELRMEDLLEEGAYTDVKTGYIKELESLPEHYFDQTQMGR